MKKILLSFILLYCGINSYAQESQPTFVMKNNFTIGKNLNTRQDISGTSYMFDGKISAEAVFPGNDALSLFLIHEKKSKNKGSVLVYEMNNEKIRWERPLSLLKEDVLLFDDQIILRTNKGSVALNQTNGDTLWRNDGNILYFSRSQQVGLGYAPKFLSASSILHGVNLKDGSTLWKKKITYEYGWNEVLQLNDSEWLIVADGVHKININTGEGWDYYLATGENVKRIASQHDGFGNTDIAIPQELLPGSDKLYGLVSNLLLLNSTIYIASKNTIQCLDGNGKPVWKKSLPQPATGKTFIFNDENNLYVINPGYGIHDKQETYFGNPYIAAFDLNNGKEQYMKRPTKNVIYDYKFQNGSLYLLSAGKLLTIDLASGNTVSSEAMQLNKKEDITAFASSTYYLNNENQFSKIEPRSGHLLLTGKQNILVDYDIQNKTIKQYQPEHLFVENYKIDNYTCISQNKRSVWLAQDLAPVVNLNIGLNSFRSGEYIFNVEGNTIHKVLISDITGK